MQDKSYSSLCLEAFSNPLSLVSYIFLTKEWQAGPYRLGVNRSEIFVHPVMERRKDIQTFFKVSLILYALFLDR